jgi:predicted RNase H-like nuclease (RuvC/YqgF family)
MWVVRLKSIESILHLRSFASRPIASSNFDSGQNRVIEEKPKEVAMINLTSANDPRTTVLLVREGGIALSEILFQPMTEAQAAAWLAALYL